jgi:hypothetical protein
MPAPIFPMATPKSLLFLAALALTVLAAPLACAQETLFNSVGPKSGDSVEVRSLFGTLPTHGYAPIRVTAANSTSHDRTFVLDFTSNDKGFNFGGNRKGSTMQSSFALTAKANRTTEIDIIVPVVTGMNTRSWGGHSGMVSLDVAMNGNFGSFNGSMQSWFNADFPGVLISQALHTPNGSALDSKLASSTSSSGWGSPTFAGNFNPAAMPEDWRAYSGFDAIMITANEWTALAPGARNAILEWNRLGGRLIVYSTDKSSDLSNLGIGPDAILKAHRSFGSVEIRLIPSSLSLDTGKTLSLIQKSSASIPPPMLPSLAGDIPGSWPIQKNFGEQGFHAILFIIVLIVFAVLVGPVNLFVFAKSGRRHRLFITTPIISLSASAVLVLLIIFQDGFGGRGFRTALVEVRADGDEHLAYLHQEQFSRTGVLLGRRFEIAEAATILPVPLPPNRWARITTDNGGGNAHYSLQPSGAKTIASGDWFQSRSEQGHMLQAIIPTRGRIERLGDSTPPRLMSSFDFPIEYIYFTGKDGKNIWAAADLQPGRPVNCEPVSKSEFQQFIDSESDRLSKPNSIRLRRIAPRKNHFLAVSGSGPFVETYSSINWARNHCVLAGPVVRSGRNSK